MGGEVALHARQDVNPHLNGVPQHSRMIRLVKPNVWKVVARPLAFETMTSATAIAPTANVVARTADKPIPGNVRFASYIRNPP